MASPAAKTCSKCGQTKSLDEFQPNRAGKFGRKSTCRACNRAQAREWKQRNRERTLELKRESWARHRDRLNAQRRSPEQRARANAQRKKAGWKKYPRDPIKANARLRVNYAVRTGKLTREPCADCGAGRVHAHHEDYSKPLDVVWLCPRCHSARHHAKEVV